MLNKSLKIAVLTGNNSTGEQHLIRLLRSEFDNVIIVAAKPKNPTHFTLRYTAGMVWKIVRLSFKKVFLRYDYCITPLVKLKPKVDVEELDINSTMVRTSLERFKPDVICIYGTKKIADHILATAPISLNIHNGFVPYYRGVSSGYWVSLESNFNYLSYSIHQATSTIDAGNVYSSEPVIPHFFESLPDHQYRQSIVSAKAMLRIVKNIASGKTQSFKQPDLGTRNLKHKHKPLMFTSKAVHNFVSQNAILYKHTTPRKGRIENFLVKRLHSRLPTTMANGWFIVNYHAIVDQTDFPIRGLPGIVTEMNQFHQHIKMYSDEFEFTSLSDGLRHFQSGATQNNKYISVTFDDALRLPDEVLELLSSKGIKPTLFLNSDPVIRRLPLENHLKYLKTLFKTIETNKPFECWVKSQYLSIGDIRSLVDRDVVEIGSHTAAHTKLNHTRQDDIETQITGAHKELERELQLNLDYFAFPFGGLSDRSFLAEYEAIKTSSYYFSCSGGVNQRYAPGELLRIGIHNESEAELTKLLCRQYVR